LRPDPARWFDYKIDVQCAKYLKITLVEVAFPQVCFLDRLFQPAETKNPQPVAMLSPPFFAAVVVPSPWMTVASRKSA
jgi:hypothetical protein